MYSMTDNANTIKMSMSVQKEVKIKLYIMQFLYVYVKHVCIGEIQYIKKKLHNIIRTYVLKIL